MAIKKTAKYVPNTKFPAKDSEWRLLDKSGKHDDFFALIDIWNTKVRPHRNIQRDYYEDWVERYKNNPTDYPIEAWKDTFGVWNRRALYTSIWPYTDEYKSLNDAFMKEYGEREDLQEIYKEGANQTWYFYDCDGNHYSKQEADKRGWLSTPQDYTMYRAIINRSTEASKKIELARETPYLEGDLVLLRKPFVGRRNVDPLWVNPYSEEARNGATTPDSSTLRIGTVVGVTDRVNGYYVPKGSKIIQLIWMGVTDSQIVDVEERYIKWHERPTYKNGMKKRPENRE